jgi:gliding motility-associated-like protein
MKIILLLVLLTGFNLGYGQTVQEIKDQIPTQFTPDGDGLNDSWGPEINQSIYNYTLKIYNRWGVKVFQSTDINNKWDSSYMGTYCESGVYIYVVEFWMDSKHEIIKGTVELFR